MLKNDQIWEILKTKPFLCDEGKKKTRELISVEKWKRQEKTLKNTGADNRSSFLFSSDKIYT